MKTQMKMAAKLMVITALSALALVGCGDDNGSVPKAYQGTFADQTGVKLDLAGDSAQLVVEGKTLSEKVAPLTYDTLLAGTPGFYIEAAEKGASIMNVYMVTPDVSSKKEEAGIVYYVTDIVYMQIDLSQKDAVPSVTIVHADQGNVMLDTQAKNWQAGWPAHSNEYVLVRTGAAAVK